MYNVDYTRRMYNYIILVLHSTPSVIVTVMTKVYIASYYINKKNNRYTYVEFPHERESYRNKDRISDEIIH